jgi:hypothetical protein
MGCTIIFSVISAVCFWGAFTADEWDMRGCCLEGAGFFAYVTYRRIKWLASEEDRRRTDSHVNPADLNPDAPADSC